VLAALFVGAHAVPLYADGLIHKLPPDGMWARFDLSGEGRAPNGDVQVKFTGTLTVKSVGQDAADGRVCRWIEIETTAEAERRGQKQEQTETWKLLIPEEFLATGQNPRAHVVKAFKKDRAGKVHELDVHGKDAQAIESLDEFFHAPLAESTKSEGVELVAPAGTFRCTKLDGKESSQVGDSGVETEVQTWLCDEAPFGVAAYRHSKSRSRGGLSVGTRSMELKLAKTGTDAKSDVGP
jgi:hypothetical protein